jgi:hypothetical protein
MVAEFEYDGVTTGAFGDVIPGQTVLIGSGLGLSDVGIGRIRKALTASTVYIGETSEISFADDLYVTVIDAFDPFPRHPKIVDETPFMDYDIPYSDQNKNYDPICIMGGQVVLDVQSYPVAVTFPDVADSSVFDSTITAKLFEASAGVVTNETTDNPTLTVSSYPTGGYIRVSLKCTTATGKVFTSYRYVLVYDSSNPPIKDFTLVSATSSRGSGGGRAEVKLNDNTDYSDIRERGLAVLFSRDYYQETLQSVGPYLGRENVLLSGWIYTRKETSDPEFDPRNFEIQSAAFWLDRMPAFPSGVRITDETSDAWTDAESLTVDKGLFHFLHWRSTVTAIMDVTLTGNSLFTGSCESPDGTLWRQVSDIANSQLLAAPLCNSNGKLFVEVPYNLTPSADRAAAVDDVMDLATTDYIQKTELSRSLQSVSQVSLSGVAVEESGDAAALFSLSPGHVPATTGDPLSVTNLLLEDQSQANSLAGLIFGERNNVYKDISLTLIGNNRLFDIAPLQKAGIAMSEYTGELIPVAVGFAFSDGKLTFSVTFESETFEEISVNGDVPVGDGDFWPLPTLPTLPPLTLFPGPDLTIPTVSADNDYPQITPPVVDTLCSSPYSNMFPVTWSRTFLDGLQSDKLKAFFYVSCKIRPSSDPYNTYIALPGLWSGDAPFNYNVYGLLAGVRVITATVTQARSGNRADFSPVSTVEVDGFEIELTSGVGTAFNYGDVIATGTVQANDELGNAHPVFTPNKVFSLEGLSGSWEPGGGNPTNYEVGLKTGTVFLVRELRETAISPYFRRYYVALLSTHNVSVLDGPGQFADNTGSMTYAIRNATGRQIDLAQSTLFNVCAV